jgi:hypothetical protein
MIIGIMILSIYPLKASIKEETIKISWNLLFYGKIYYKKKILIILLHFCYLHQWNHR